MKLIPVQFSDKDLTPYIKDFWEGGETETSDEIRNNNEIVINSWSNNQPVGPVNNFEESHFPTCVLNTLQKDLNFNKPTAVQMQTWPCALKGYDLISLAKTGSGKTLAFVLPAMAQISMNTNNIRQGPRCLILAPTRELANQIFEEAMRFGKPWRVAITCCYGGVPKMSQKRDLRNGVNIIIATPGRLIDLVKEGECNLKEVTYFVLDEADRMLDMGFKPQINEILSQLRPDRQTLMFSATWPKEVQTLAYSVFKYEPVQIMIGNDSECSYNDKILQEIKFVEDGNKFDEL